MRLRAVGFCGVDESVDPSLLALISLRYPAIEWGVLFRPDKAGEPRYPGAAWVDRLASHAAASAGGMALAGHLCGERAVEVIRNQSAFVERLEAKGFARVQLNPTAVNGVCLRAIGLDVDQAASGICACIDATPALEWILQYNDETRELCEAVLATLRRAGDPVRPASVLFDASCGPRGYGRDASLAFGRDGAVVASFLDLDGHDDPARMIARVAVYNDSQGAVLAD